MEEIDISVLISYLSQKNKSENIIISIQEIRKLGHAIEELHPSITFDMDKYSIESFRIKAKGSVSVNDNKISFNKTDKYVQVLLNNNQPSDTLNALLEEIIEKIIIDR